MNDQAENIQKITSPILPTENNQIPSPKSNIDILSVELGDVIKIHAYRNTNIDQQTYYVYYIDDLKLKLLNTSNHQLLQLRIDGYVADESITAIDLLSRSEVAGFAKQHKLLPPQWIDVHFNGDVPVVISGEITNLEEDMIEITTYPGMRVIYVDFAYQGIPESLPIDKIVLRERPKALNTSLRGMMEGVTEMNREEAEAEPTVEFDAEDGQMIVNIPENAPVNPSPNDVIEEYLQTEVEVPPADGEEEDGELEALEMFFEVRESDRRYSEEIQVADLLGELISKLPADKRTALAMKDIHKFVTRFKELRRVFSVFDENGDVVMPKTTSILHKPIIDHIVKLDRDIKWVLPVTYESNELMSHSKRNTKDDYNGAPTHVETSMAEFMNNVEDAQRIFSNAGQQTDTNKYDKMTEEIDTLCAPAATNNTPENVPIYLKNVETKCTTEMLVSNDNDFHMDTSVSITGSEFHTTGTSRFVTRRYTGASSRLVLDENTRRRIYIRKDIGKPDCANIRSIVMLPRPVLMQSQSKSPSANLYLKSKLSEIPVYKFRFLTPHMNIATRSIDNLDKELVYEDSVVSLKTAAAESESEPAPAGEPFLNVPVNYVIHSRDAPINEETFRQFLNAIIPRTRTLIRWMRSSIEHLYSFADIVASLEPFFVESEDITFKQYIEIRYYVKEKIRKYVAKLATTRKTYDALKSINKDAKPHIDRIMTILNEEKDFHQYFLSIYKLSKADGEEKEESADKKKLQSSSSSETLNNILKIDGASAISAILNLYLMEFLTIPESVIGMLKEPAISSEDARSIAKSKCDRRFIAKKYHSVEAMRKDDNTRDVFYDKEYDDTPYHLVDKYKDEKKRFRDEEEFREFFTETLIHKHDCPSYLAASLANTILAKKKRVSNGEYAMLETKPSLAEKLREDDATDSKEKRENEIESETRKRIEYYRRVKDAWELDKTVTIDSFVDTNTLFCELSESCNKITDVNQCVPTEMAALQMRLAKRARMIEEFDERVARSFDEVADEIRAKLTIKKKQIRRDIALDKTRLYRQSSYCFELGKYAKSTESIIESPHSPLIERIMAWPDFVEKQNMIYTFVRKFCRDPNPHLDEDPHWMYCADTNTKLFPESLFLLSTAFLYDEYTTQLESVIRDKGQLSDDGDAIVDKYTGYVLRKIDYSSEEGFDDSGFRIVTNAVEEKDIGTMVLETLAKKDKVFENPTAQSAYNVFHTLSENMGIQKDTTESSIEEFVLRVTLEIMNDPEIVMTEDAYAERLAQMVAQSSKKTAKMPYSTYYNQNLIIIVSCSTFAAMQTLIPSFKTKKTFPGCVKSFAGYPLDPNIENVTGMRYIACVLDKSKRASTLPWSAIEPLSVDILLKRMKTVMQSCVYIRPDVEKLYNIKRDYLIHYPDQDVPEEVAIKRWTHFLPPVVPFSMEHNSVTGISEEYEKELFKAILNGSDEQLKTLGIIKGKLLKHGYLTYNIIDQIVRKKQLLLVSNGGAAFLENACCNEDGARTNPIGYFQQDRPELVQVLQKARKMENVLTRVKNLTKAKTFFDPKSSRIVGASIPDTIISRTIYETFIHYCNFDNDAAIPADLIPLTATKPEYNRFASIDEKIAFMKRHGKNYGIEDFYSIMRIVNSRNVVHRNPDKEIGALSGLKDMLAYFDDKNSVLVENRLRELLRITLNDYDPKVAVHEERSNNQKLNRYLQRANDGMQTAILTFLDTHANLDLGNMDKMSTFFETVASWNIGDLPSIVKEISNMIHNIAKVYPSKTLKNRFQSIGNKHWNFSLTHQKYLEDNIRSFYKDIAAYAETDIEQSPEERTYNQKKENTLTTFQRYLSSAMINLTDLVLFMETIPVFAPLTMNGVKYWTLYSDNTVKLLYKYVLLSAVHEYVVLANDTMFTQLRAEEIKMAKRLDRSGVPNANVYDDIDESEDYGASSQIRQVHIVESDATELKKTAALWLTAVLRRELDTKTVFNRSYSEIMDNTMSLKYKDKKHITDYLAALSRDERRVEQMLRSHKIGRWNVGMQKGLYQYDKTVYNKEAAQWHTDNEEVVIVAPQPEGEEGGEEVEDLERMERIQQSAEYDGGDGIEDMTEEYMDGIYYEEDAERDDYGEY